MELARQMLAHSRNWQEVLQMTTTYLRETAILYTGVQTVVEAGQPNQRLPAAAR